MNCKKTLLLALSSFSPALAIGFFAGERALAADTDLRVPFGSLETASLRWH
jgi:hypothetical protein